jgi:2'-5' RNA ligase
MADGSRRLFFALWPDAAAAGKLHEAAKAARAACGGRLMRRETLHVTLAFLGAVAGARVAEAEAAAAAAAAAGATFALDIDRLAYWRHNRILWAGCTAPPAALLRLADGLGQGLREAGFRLDARPFAVHATLLRNADCPAVAPALPETIRWQAADFVLVESHPAPEGSRYEPLRRWRLGRRQAG